MVVLAAALLVAYSTKMGPLRGNPELTVPLRIRIRG